MPVFQRLSKQLFAGTTRSAQKEDMHIHFLISADIFQKITV